MQVQNNMHVKIIESLKRESFTIFIVCLAIFISIAGLIHFVLPSYHKMNHSSHKLTTYHDLISSKNGYSKIKQEIEKKNKILSGRLDALSAAASGSEDLSFYLETLIGKAKVSDIQFVKMQPQNETRTSDFILCPVVINLTTNYHALGQFVSSIEKLPHMFKVERLAMESTTIGKLETRILVTCYIPSMGEK